MRLEVQSLGFGGLKAYIGSKGSRFDYAKVREVQGLEISGSFQVLSGP